jgi:hypothetical protein
MVAREYSGERGVLGRDVVARWLPAEVPACATAELEEEADENVRRSRLSCGGAPWLTVVEVLLEVDGGACWRSEPSATDLQIGDDGDRNDLYQVREKPPVVLLSLPSGFGCSILR